MSEVQALPVAEVDYKWPDDELVVRLSDYDALAAECERLREERDSYQRIGIRNMQACDAALAELAALKGGQGAVSKLQWPEIVGLVNEVLGCEAHKFPCSRGSIGHEMTGINFNSLARIIDLVRHSYPAPPAQASAWVAERYTCIGKGGSYLRVGTSIGAGDNRGEIVEVYRDESNGQLYHRDTENFFVRMTAAPTPGASDGKGGDV